MQCIRTWAGRAAVATACVACSSTDRDPGFTAEPANGGTTSGGGAGGAGVRYSPVGTGGAASVAGMGGAVAAAGGAVAAAGGLNGIAGAARHFESLGAEIVPVQLPELEAALHAFATIFHAEAAHAHQGGYPEHADDYGPHFAEMVSIGRSITGADYAAAHAERLAFTGRLRRFLEGIDALLCPAAMTPAPPAAAIAHAPANFYHMGPSLAFTAPYTLAGVPALTVPCGFADPGVPLVFQLVGAPFTEAQLLRLARAYEASTDVHTQHPVP